MLDARKTLKKNIVTTLLILFAGMFIVGSVFAVRSYAQEGPSTQLKAPPTETEAAVSKFAFLAAAGAFGLGAIGAGVAIGNVGAAAMGAVAEKPEIAGQALIFVALAEGLVVFGFITALMILGKV
jgi:V/A-type H+-transporting ATPase subunit K